jgi:hypothetical protein
MPVEAAMTDYDALDPDDGWPEPEPLTADDEPHSSTYVRVDSPWHEDIDPHAAGEWIADVERPADN